MKPTKLLIIGALALSGTAAHAQLNFDEIIKAQKNDAEVLLRSYMSPAFKAFSAGLNTGWYNTGKTHSLGRPDLTFTVNTVLIPSSDRTMDLGSLGLQSVTYTQSSTPTFAGKSSLTPAQLNVMAKHSLTQQDTAIASFTMPKGTGLGFLPVPVAQLGIGVPFGTDLIVRYIPTLTLGDGSIGLFGVGVKHDIKQWIPGISALPFDWSVLFGYTSLNASYRPEPKTGSSSIFNDQEMTFNVSGYNLTTIVSKKLSVLTVYGGLGYDAASTTLKVNGTFPVVRSYNPDGTPKPETVVNPVDVSINTSNGAKITAGFRLRFLVFTFHADYTLAKYPIATAGLGLSLGN
jgi:hypothetical protein